VSEVGQPLAHGAAASRRRSKTAANINGLFRLRFVSATRLLDAIATPRAREIRAALAASPK
jgi:hypothetical protein